MAYSASPLTIRWDDELRTHSQRNSGHKGYPGADSLARAESVRCYFHLVNGSEEIRDTEGLEVADLEQAHAEALETLHALAREDEEAAAAWAGWRLDVCDASGALLFSIGLDGTGAIH
jgi:hypothetical protein